MIPGRRVAFGCFGVAVLAVALGVSVAAGRYPGGFDWMYMVVSRLASLRRNPEGARWAAGGLLVAAGFLWPVTIYLARATGEAWSSSARRAATLLRIGLVGGALLGIEGVLGLRFSQLATKAHEALALVTFLGFYGGVLGLFRVRVRAAAAHALPAFLVVCPLLAVGLTQLVLYLDQRDLGWVDTSWRDLGVPVWLSFAFWQWLAIVLLGLGIGYLVASGGTDEPDGSGGRSVPPGDVEKVPN